MNVNPKAFEERVREGWMKSFPNGLIVRLYDNMSGYINISNVSDFIAYEYPNIYFLECKVHKGASIPFSVIPQYDDLIKVAGLQGVRSGVIIYLYDKEKVYYVPAKTIKQMKEDGKKSVGLKAVKEGYRIIDIPSKKLRVFMDSDYTVLKDLKEGD